MKDMEKMKFVDKCNILFRLIDKTDYFWNFCIISSGTILFFIINDNLSSLSVLKKILMTIVYSSFMFFNLQAHIRGYKFLQEYVEEVKEDIKNQDFQNQRLPILFQKLSYKQNTLLCIVIYLGIFIVTLTLFWI